jgi:spore germination protein YaaH
MKKALIYYIIFFSLFGAFLFPQNSLAQQYNLEKIFYLPKYNAEKGVESLAENWQKIDILAPQFHVVNADFTVSGSFGPDLKKIIKSHPIKVMPLIANANFSQKIIHNLLNSQVGQDKVITNLIQLAKSNGYIGWQFDFENINYQDKDLYTAFVQRAYPLFHVNKLILSIVVVSRSSDYEDTDAFKNWSGAYDYKKLAESSDFISLMAYDDPNSLGPVASIDFINKALNYVKDKIPANKLSLGVPLYYWKWDAGTNKKVGSGLYNNILAIIASHRYVMSFDQSLGASCLTYSYKNKNYKVWFEDKQSFQAKLNIVQDNNLRGFSAWLLGGEDPNIWTVLSNTPSH